ACREVQQPGRRNCYTLMNALRARYHADQTYTVLRELIAKLGAIREERKNLVFVSDHLPRWRGDVELQDRLAAGTPTAGIDSGRVGLGDPHKTAVTDYSCAADVNRLPMMDFENRYQQVLTEALQANVAFYAIPPSGLQASRPTRVSRADAGRDGGARQSARAGPGAIRAARRHRRSVGLSGGAATSAAEGLASGIRPQRAAAGRVARADGARSPRGTS